MKKTSLMCVGALLAVATQLSAALPQHRNFRAGASPEVSRTVTADEDRSELRVLKTRGVTSTGSSLIIKPSVTPTVRPSQLKRSASAAKLVSPTLQVYGTVIYNANWTDTNPTGVYRLPVENGEVTELQFKCNSPLYSFFDGDHTVYSMYELAYGSWVMGYDLYKYDTETNEQVGVIEFDDLPIKATDVAYDPVSGKVYGCFSGDYYGDVYRHWGYLDMQAKNVVKIADMDFSLRGVAIDKFGKAYGISTDGDLYTIDKETGETTFVGATGCPSLYYMSSAAFNDKDNNIILSFANDSSEGGGLVAINPATAESTVVSVFAGSDEVIGLYIPFQAPDKAPAAPAFTATCSEGSMTVDFTITMPSTLYDGTAADGQPMGYKIYADGEEILSGDSEAGAIVEVSKALATSGNVTFIAVATNDEGESNQTKATCYVGKGTPRATSDVTLTYADGAFTLTWTPVTESADGGYLNPADVRYDITDAEGAVIAEDLDGSTMTIEQTVPENFTRYAFGVVAKYDGKASKAIMSNNVYLGHHTAPLTLDMQNADNFAQHSVIDANADSKTWYYSTSKGTVYDYDKNNDADDWLISPAIYLEEGKAYDFAAEARAYSDRYPEKLEIMMGTAPTAEAMTISLVEATELGGTPSTLSANIAPTASGEYYIGFHAVSEAMQWTLYLNSYSLSAPYGATAPDAVTDIALVPDVTGELSVALNFKAPTTTVTGAPYSGNAVINVLRDDAPIAELTVTAGQDVTYNDKVEESGRYNYTFVSLNEAGETGRTATASVFVGPNVPGVPTAVKVVENPDKNGELTITWERPSADIDGNPLHDGNLTYNVYKVEDNQWKLLTKAPQAERTFTFQAQDETAPQTFVQIGIQAINKGIEGDEFAGAGLIPVGPAYTLPVAMSCLNDAKKYIIGLDAWDGCEFGMKADGEMSSVTSQDGDGQFFYGERVGSSATLGMGKGVGDFIFGKVDLTGATHPVFSLYTWKITETDKTKLEIHVICEGESKLVQTIDYDEDTHNLWTKKIVNLDEYAGKTIQLFIRYYSDGLVYCFIDNMKFMDMPDYDINAVSVTAPKTVNGGETFEVTATVENVGRLTAGPFVVQLLSGSNIVGIKSVKSLEPGAFTEVVFEQVINMAQDKEMEYTARVVYAGDADASNDVTPKSAKVTRKESSLPCVSNLTGENGDACHILTWDAITPENLPYDPTVESFEDSEAFVKEYPGWTFVDRDGAPCGGLGNLDIPNHVAGTDPESFIVIDGTYSSLANSSYAKEYRAADGKQYIGSIWTRGENANEVIESDDWAISPALKGCAQTVTFSVKNASINYSERLQVMYSTSDSVDPEDFVVLDSFNNKGYTFRNIRTDGWESMSFDLPEGAKRFAFHVISDDGMMLMIDEVSYLAADATVGLELVGYNVYCNGVKLNSSPVTDTTYTNTDITKADSHTYHVTAVYNRGESEVSEPVVLATSALGSLKAALRINVEGRDIVITGAGESSVLVASIDGKVLLNTAGDARVTVPATGIYLVTVDKETTKVSVR